MNIEDDPRYRYYARVTKLMRLLEQYRDISDEMDTGDEILYSREISGMAPNRVVACLRQLEEKRTELRKQIRSAAIHLAKCPLEDNNQPQKGEQP